MPAGLLPGGTISIHALLAESDDKLDDEILDVEVFLSTLSLRRATTCCAVSAVAGHISIHALLAESDRALRQL